MKFLKANSLSIAALLIMLAASIQMWERLPEMVATSFDLQGNAIASSSKAVVVVLLPLIYLGLIVAVNLLIRISPQKFSMPNSKRAMDIIVFGVGVLFCFLHIGLLINSSDPQLFQRLFALGVAGFLVVTGNVFGKTERNFFIGIRLPWTIASTANWRATHRLAGTLMVISGLLLAGLSFIYSSTLITTIFCVAPLLIPVIYSPVYYFRHEQDKDTDD
jgi:uncharacterized membrane protein